MYSTELRIHAYGRERSSLADCEINPRQAPVSAILNVLCQVYYTRSEQGPCARQLYTQGNVDRKVSCCRYKGSAAIKGSPERRIRPRKKL